MPTKSTKLGQARALLLDVLSGMNGSINGKEQMIAQMETDLVALKASLEADIAARLKINNTLDAMPAE